MIGMTDVDGRFDAQSRVKLAIASGSLFLRLQRGDSLLFCTPPDAIDVSVKIGTPSVMARLKFFFTDGKCFVVRRKQLSVISY